MPRKRLASAVGALLCLCVLGLGGLSRAEQNPDLQQADSEARRILQQAKKNKTTPDAKEAVATKDATPKGRKSADAEVELRILVFSKTASKSGRGQQLARAGASVLKDLRLINAVTVAVPSAQAKKLDDGTQAIPGVQRVEKDFRQNWLQAAPGQVQAPGRLPFELTASPQEIALLSRVQQHIPWGVDRTNAKDVWRRSRGAGVKVAVVDTGVDTDHPDIRVKGGFSAISGHESYKDDNGHGTHVAGTIAALDNGEGVVGVAPEAELYAVKVLDSGGSGTFSDVIEGIQWCAEHGIQVANFSLGASAGTQALADAVTAAAAAGVTLVVAAGNSGGDVSFPGAYPHAIAVAAMDFNGGTAEFSSRGPQVAFIAPGVDVLSTYMGGGYRTLSGTSMATPHVSGLAVLAIALRGARGPEQVLRALARAASPLDGTPEEQQGWGAIDASRLLKDP